MKAIKLDIGLDVHKDSITIAIAPAMKPLFPTVIRPAQRESPRGPVTSARNRKEAQKIRARDARQHRSNSRFVGQATAGARRTRRKSFRLDAGTPHPQKLSARRFPVS